MAKKSEPVELDHRKFGTVFVTAARLFKIFTRVGPQGRRMPSSPAEPNGIGNPTKSNFAVPGPLGGPFS